MMNLPHRVQERWQIMSKDHGSPSTSLFLEHLFEPFLICHSNVKSIKLFSQVSSTPAVHICMHNTNGICQKTSSY